MLGNLEGTDGLIDCQTLKYLLNHLPISPCFHLGALWLKINTTPKGVGSLFLSDTIFLSEQLSPFFKNEVGYFDS
jgi:hypothetical protein